MNTPDTNTTQKATSAASWLTSKLTGWGVPTFAAGIISGAIIGAATAAWMLLSSSCTVDATYTAAGDGSYHYQFDPIPFVKEVAVKTVDSN